MNFPRWRIGEENTGGGFNIYRGETRVAHTAEISQRNATRGEVITSEQAKATACLIVNAVNAYLENAETQLAAS